MKNPTLFILAAAFLSSVLGGCVIPRCPFALSNKDLPVVPVAVLPVEISPRVNEKEYAHAELQKLADKVVDTLAKSEDDNLIGPEEVRLRLGSEDLPESLRWLDVYSEIEVTPSTIDAFRELSCRLGVNEVIRSSLSITGYPPEEFVDSSGFAESWEVEVKIRMELVDLETGKVLKRAQGKGDAGGTAGFFMYIPIYIDNTLGKGIDQAFRAAFKEMYRAPDPNKKPDDPMIVPFEKP